MSRAPSARTLTAPVVALVFAPFLLSPLPALAGGAAVEPCHAGDLVVTELMVAAASDSREWFEVLVLVPAGGACSLDACEIREGPFDTVTTENLTSEDWDFHTISDALLLDAGARVLFARGSEIETVAGQPGDPGAVAAAYSYSGVTFSNSEAGWLHLRCGGETIDTVPYDWSRFDVSCGSGPWDACSVNLPESKEDPASNDDLLNWCLPPEEPLWDDSQDPPATQQFRGTPGLPGSCLVRDWPGAGEMLFTEAMIHPVQSEDEDAPELPEWTELLNTAARPLELAGCTLRKYRLAEDGSIDVTSVDGYVIGTSGEAPVVDAAVAQVLSDGACIDGGLPFSGHCAYGEQDHYTYGGISLVDSRAEFLELLCPLAEGGEVSVDVMGYDWTKSGAREGHSLQFDPRTDSAASANDVPANWCEASFERCIPGAVTDEGLCNFGTPGTAGDCETGQLRPPESGVPGCVCDAGGRATAPRSGPAAAALLGLALLGRRRQAPCKGVKTSHLRAGTEPRPDGRRERGGRGRSPGPSAT